MCTQEWLEAKGQAHKDRFALVHVVEESDGKGMGG